MSLLSVAELQAQIETDYDNTTIQQIIDAVERYIDEYIGPTTGYVVEYDETELLTVLRLPVEASTITSIVEYTESESEPEKTTLSSDDYGLSDDGWDIRRRSDGTNERTTWGWHIVVTFEPSANAERRKQAAIKLARLEIDHGTYLTERIGDWDFRSKDIKKERSIILSGLDTTGGV